MKNKFVSSSWKFNIAVIVVSIFAFVLRVFNLNYPKKFIMDEIYYVPDAASILKNGYEIAWDRTQSESSLLASFLDGSWSYSFLEYGSTHPPLGKFFIALGMLFFGPYDSFGWRISAVVAGSLVVTLVMVLAYLIFNNRKVSLIAGLIVAVDPMMIAMSRVSHLDIFVTLFALSGVIFATIYIKRKSALKRYNLFFNPWVPLAFVSFGLASAVKWSGVYFLFAFAIFIFIVNIVNSKYVSGLRKYWDAFAVGILSVTVSLVAYFSTWTLWLLTIGNKGDLWSSINSLLTLHVKLFKDNASLVEKHGYGSNAFEWVLQSHPTLLFYEKNNLATVSSVSSMPNLLVWYGGIISLIVLIVLIFRKKIDLLLGLVILVSVAAGWLPWMLSYGRTIFQFYTVIFAPYIFIALAYVMYITFIKVTSYKKSKINLYRLGFLSYVLIALVFAFKLYGGSVGLEQIDSQSSYAMFTQWQHFAEDYGIYDSSQEPEMVKKNSV